MLQFTQSGIIAEIIPDLIDEMPETFKGIIRVDTVDVSISIRHL